MSWEKYIEYNEEVKEAISSNRPVVALESTLVAHGMPYPENFQTASQLEQIIRKVGAVPATIAILDGKIRVGLDEKQLYELSTDSNIFKASRRDIGYCLSQKKSAATTVASTMFCANWSGIEFFATGGIGGVHRGVAQTWDISADLHEFFLSTVMVVSAGAKSILDLPKTLEFLESLGIPVVGYQTQEFPAFFSQKSGLSLPLRLNTPQELAEMAFTQWDLGLHQGILVANPIPQEFALDPTTMESQIQHSMKKANELGIRGKELTPFLLDQIKEQTQGLSLKANIELVKNNALLAAQVAIAYHKILKERGDE